MNVYNDEKMREEDRSSSKKDNENQKLVFCSLKNKKSSCDPLGLTIQSVTQFSFYSPFPPLRICQFMR